jgi:hypothetical protein
MRRFNPDAAKVAYVRANDIYVEDTPPARRG